MFLWSSADNLCKQFGPRSGSTERLDPNCVSHFLKKLMSKKSGDDKENMKNYPAHLSGLNQRVFSSKKCVKTITVS